MAEDEVSLEPTVGNAGAWIVAGVMLLIGPFISGFLAAIHTLLWIGVGILLIALGLFERTKYTAAEERASRTTCSNCGARVPADRPDCEYCGEPFEQTDGS